MKADGGRAALMAAAVAALAMLALGAGTLFPAPAQAAARNLDQWLEADLGPALAETLAGHPRFRGEPVRVQVTDGEGEPVARPDALTARFAERLAALLAARQGVVLADAPGGGPSAEDPRSCLPPPERYRLAVEAMPAPPGQARLRVRALDLGDAAWVPGLVHEWQGRLAPAERALAARTTEVAALRGRRELPYATGEDDLAAARLAGALACQLRAHPAESPGLRVAGGADGIGTLAARYLAGAGLVRLSGEAEDGLVATASRVPITDELEQLWVALSPDPPDAGLPEVRAMVYLRPGPGGATPAGPALSAPAVAPPPAPVVAAAAPPSAVRSAPARLSPLTLLFLPDGCEAGRCGGPARVLHPAAPLPGAGLAVALTGAPGAGVYLYRVGGGRLTALGPGACGAGRHLLGADGRLRVPLEADPRLSGLLAVGAPAAGDEALLETPGRDCAGLAGARLERWLEALSAAGIGRPGSEGWQALAVASPADRVTLAREGRP